MVYCNFWCTPQKRMFTWRCLEEERPGKATGWGVQIFILQRQRSHVCSTCNTQQDMTVGSWLQEIATSPAKVQALSFLCISHTFVELIFFAQRCMVRCLWFIDLCGHKLCLDLLILLQVCCIQMNSLRSPLVALLHIFMPQNECYTLHEVNLL